MKQPDLFDGARTRLMPRGALQKALGRAPVNDAKKAEARAWFEHLQAVASGRTAKRATR